MTVWYVDEGFEDEDPDFDRGRGAWEQGYLWDDVNLFITFDDEEPYYGETCVVVGYMGDGIFVPEDNGLGEASFTMLEGPLGDNFYGRAVGGCFK